ncbi:alpha-tectorin-like [Cololabis saira]|uniref:alpha-tectorin-like n=1 Tax=Cololabis saira TaxID=129043 RepID=UPI002AD517EC|nr:alpha-tectorin-like [Cololabis saira]
MFLWFKHFNFHQDQEMENKIPLLVLLLSVIGGVAGQDPGPLYPINGTASSRSDDGSSPRIDLERPFVYFGRTYNGTYVNHNGHITFDGPLRTFSPQRFPLHGPRDFISPFWTDLDNRANGQVLYNQYTSGSVLQQATQDINSYFPHINFHATWVFVATWYEVAYFPTTGTRTTVQAVLISGGQYSFVFMNYGIIANTSRNVQAGYDTINSDHHFSIPGSFSHAATGSNSVFSHTSNINVPGRWAFQVDHGSTGCTFIGQPVQLGDSFWSDRTCTQKCTCTSAGLQCSYQPCSFSQICTETSFHYSCQTVQRRTCTISGDPHYYTFDNSVFHFQGTCTYVLSEQCHNSLPYYRVEGKNEHRGSTRVSWTRLVKVYVYNETIELVKGHSGRAKVNGNFASTPFYLNNGTVQVYESGFTVTVSTDFGLMVSYDTNHYVRISLPYTYQNATCGLCGDFDDDPDDDFRTREGEVVSSDVVFANSWQAAGDDEPGCEAQCGGLDCAVCTADETALYSNGAHCGILRNSSGPFAVCHQLLPPQTYMESCLYDLCVGGGYQPILCQALNVYASQCQQNGVQLPNWRRSGFCEIPCPANSHFESHASGCPSTCVNPNSANNCSLPDLESCVCNTGYILSGGVCVPHYECGCSFEGRYYRSGETVILDEDCGRRCSCSYGSMTCNSHGCGPHESCQVEDGERGCRPNSYATCWIRGPGSYQTFDGVTYQYPGACRLTLAKVMGLSDHPHFMVTAEKVPRGQQGFAHVLKFEAEGTQVTIEMGTSSRVKVDGEQVRLPYSPGSTRIRIYQSSVFSVILRTAFGVTVQTVWPHLVRVTAPAVYNGSLGGLCGNYNGHPHDDFLTPNGTVVNSSQEFGDSWRDGSLAAHCVESVNRNSSVDFNSSETCGILSSHHGPFTSCWAVVDPREQVDVCLDILRGSRDPASTLCEVLRDYALMCQQKGVSLGPWRNSTGCELSCPSNSHYELLGTSCPSACPSLSFPFTCDTLGQDGCQCDDGFALNGNQCVRPTSCGCYHQGRYRQSGEQFWDGEHCQSLCTCNGMTAAVQCVPTSCGPQESCRVVEGELGCHPSPHGTCSASGDPHYVTFDGRAYDFQGTCRYVLAAVCNATDEVQHFSVEAKNEALNGLPLSVTAEVFVDVLGYQVLMSRNIPGMVEVNGITRNLPILLNRNLSIFASGSQTFVSAGFGLSVTYNGWSTVSISVPSNYRYLLFTTPHKDGESFWTDGCSQRCECHAPNDLRCSPASCSPAQQCTIRDGQLGCHDAMSTCTVWGDPHYITFDGALAHFQGTCSYVITESVGHSGNETQFKVVATNNHRGNNLVSFVSAVDIYLSNQPESVHVRLGPNKRVKVNGGEVSLPAAAGTGAQVLRQGSNIVLDAVDFIVQFDGQSTLLVRMGQHCQNRVTGMCGNFNNDPTDDKVLPNGTRALNDNEFGHGWKSSTSQPGCGSTDEDPDDVNDCPFLEEYSELCSVLTNTSGPFSDCHLHSDPQPFFTSCVYDLCLYSQTNGMLCSAVSAYERTCAVLGLNIPDWRSALQCAESDPCETLDCTEYEWCGEKHGVYGCFCDEHHHRPNNESYDSSITCESSSGTMSVSRCQLFEEGFHSDVLHLRDHSCNGTLQDGRVVFHFDNDNHLCGTVLRSNGTHFMYENTIQADVDRHGDVISRQRSLQLLFCCEFPLSQALSMDVGISPVESILRKKLPVGNGLYHIRMIPFQDPSFLIPYSSHGNIEMEVDERIYVEVRTDGVDGRQISTLLDSCWATPVNVANYPVRWDLIIAECPNPEDGTVKLLQNGISTVAHFSFNMFSFTNYSSIYIHCNVHLCLLRNSNCTARCNLDHHRRFQRDASHHDSTSISVGPLSAQTHPYDSRVHRSGASDQLTSIDGQTSGPVRPKRD